ncbi:hypothetical protein GCM10010329_29690 [Streptomyces spiroverticillatus]|uniref:Uncharacterized protein n=1 Tax=Streptomyces finlayi TaxID=67296 RepID=A0A919C9T0_9ACTN|nr:hypothetical protein [Streptomyces finlayi]GHA05343.1 hypothetical protein GCM10010329_29690 [Streptomyces spiroverticillatus]GHC89225.1 hypothetical protein GCM10010334_22100 [Streptomyces finlayi]
MTSTVLVAAFLFAHGLIHLPMWWVSADASAPFDPRHSWAWKRSGTASVVLATATAVLYVVAGAALAAQAGAWSAVAVAAGVTGLVLKAVWFHPWLSFGVLLDAGVVAAAALHWPASLP